MKESQLKGRYSIENNSDNVDYDNNNDDNNNDDGDNNHDNKTQ